MDKKDIDGKKENKKINLKSLKSIKVIKDGMRSLGFGKERITYEDENPDREEQEKN